MFFRFATKHVCDGLTDGRTELRLSLHDCSCPLAPQKFFDILALYKSDYYYYYIIITIPKTALA